MQHEREPIRPNERDADDPVVQEVASADGEDAFVERGMAEDGVEDEGGGGVADEVEGEGDGD